MSQTDITNSNQYQQAAVKTRPPHSSAAECDFLSAPRLRRTCPYVTVCVSVRVQPQQFPPQKSLIFFLHMFLAAPTSRSQSALGRSHSFELSRRTCGCARGCVCISPTAAPGLHLIRPLFLSCPNRQAL